MPPVIKPELCVGCMICDRYCITDVYETTVRAEPIRVLGKKVTRDVRVKYAQECWHCGVCRMECPTGAIYYVFTESMLNMVDVSASDWLPTGVDY